MEPSAGPSPAEERGTSLASLPTELLKTILSRVSELSGSYSHAVVNREWADLAPSVQLSCVLTCIAEGEEPAGGLEPSKFAQTLSEFPNLTSLHLTAEDSSALPDSLLSVPESLQHLSIKGPAGEWPTQLLQGLSRFSAWKPSQFSGRGFLRSPGRSQLRCAFWTWGVE